MTQVSVQTESVLKIKYLPDAGERRRVNNSGSESWRGLAPPARQTFELV